MPFVPTGRKANMAETAADFIVHHTAVAEPLFKARAEAYWRANTTGRAEDQEEEARLKAEIMRLYADPEALARLKVWREAGDHRRDPLLARQVDLLYRRFLAGQRDKEVIEALTALEKAVQSRYVNHRPQVRGRVLSDNDILEILRQEKDEALRREAWEASKEVGAQVAEQVRELVRLRNASARRLGFRDHYALALFVSEIDEAWLLALLEELALRTEAPFRQIKATLDAALAERFHCTPDDLRPWHYADPFFQHPPDGEGPDLDPIFAQASLEELARRTYRGLGLDVEAILARSDLYERPGKNQHAFCLDVDRRGDVRVLCNLRPTERWMSTLLHELGHAVYDAYISRELPWLLRRPAHMLTTEAIAMLMGRLTQDPRWLREIAGVPTEQAEALAPRLHDRLRRKLLIFLRWALVMVHFERAFYADPDRPDLNELWWDLKARYQLLTPPEGRDQPDWAAKYHIAMAPVYYHNYVLGEVLASQLRDTVERSFGHLVNRPHAGEFLREAIFAPGSRWNWQETVQRATGRPLDLSPLLGFVGS